MKTDTHLGIYTDKGGRSFNEDAYLAVPLPDRPSGLIFLGGVADGVGGQVAGRAASSYAIKVLQEFFLRRSNQLTTKNLPELLRQIFYRINSNIHQKGTSSEKYAGMGTTLTCLLASPANVTIAHVGDTRVYIKRGNRIFQVTRDHLVEDTGAAEEIDERFALFEEEPVMIGRVLGVEPEVEVDIYRLDIEEGDIFLLVSDGVYQYLEEKEIIEIIDSRGSSDAAAREMGDAALANGATDNVTAVIWEATGLEEAAAVPAAATPAPAPAEERREAPPAAAAGAGRGRFAASSSPLLDAGFGASAGIEDLERLMDVALEYEIAAQEEGEAMPEAQAAAAAFEEEEAPAVAAETAETVETVETVETAVVETAAAEAAAFETRPDEHVMPEAPAAAAAFEEEEAPAVAAETVETVEAVVVEAAATEAAAFETRSEEVAAFEMQPGIQPAAPASFEAPPEVELPAPEPPRSRERFTPPPPPPPPLTVVPDVEPEAAPDDPVLAGATAAAGAPRPVAGRGGTGKKIAAAAVIVALLCVAAAAFLLLSGGKGSGVAESGMVVPALSGMTLDDARSTLETAGLECGDVRQVSSDLEAGKVVSTEPAAGSDCAADTTVSVLVSLGPMPTTRMVVLPNVLGLSQEEALAALQAAGFNVGALEEANNAEVPAGNIIALDPAPDTSYPEGTAVALVVSIGPAGPQLVTCRTCGGAGKVTCPTCGGRGTISSTTACGTCGGSGVTSTGFTCGTCGGSGRVSSSRTCSTCGGAGKITCSTCGGKGKTPQ